MQIVEVEDGAIGFEGRRDDALPAEDALRPEALGETVEVAHAVQERQNCRLRTDRLGE